MGLRRLVAVAALLATPWVVAWTCYDPVQARARRLVDHCPSVARTKAQNFDTVAKWVRDEYLRGATSAANLTTKGWTHLHNALEKLEQPSNGTTAALAERLEAFFAKPHQTADETDGSGFYIEGTVAIVATGEFERPASERTYAVNLARAAEWCRERALEPTAFLSVTRASTTGPRVDAIEAFARRLDATLPTEVLWDPFPRHVCEAQGRHVGPMLRKVRLGIDHARHRHFEYVFRLRADAYIQEFVLPRELDPLGLYQVNTASFGGSDNFVFGRADVVHAAWPFHLAEESHWANEAVCDHEKKLEPNRESHDPEKCIMHLCGACAACTPYVIGGPMYENQSTHQELEGRTWLFPGHFAFHNIKADCSGRSWRDSSYTRGKWNGFDFFPSAECRTRTTSPACPDETHPRSRC